MFKPLPWKLLLALPIFIAISLFAFPDSALGANLTTAMLRFHRMANGQNNVPILVVVKPGQLIAVDRIRLALGSSYSIDSDANRSLITVGTQINAGWIATNETLTGTALCDRNMPLASSVANTVPGSGTSGTVDFAISSTALSTTTNYCFYVTSGIGIVAANSSIQNKIETLTTPTIRDTSRVGTATVASGSDQVTISAIVPAVFTFALSATTDSFISDLSTTTAVRTSGVLVTISTNAQSGWETWLKSTASLTSAISNSTISTTGSFDGTPSTLSNGVSAYVVDVTAGTNTPAIDAEYAGGTPGNQGGTISSNAMQRIAYTTAPGSGDTVRVYGVAGISGTQPAGTDYTDTWTIVGAGQF